MKREKSLDQRGKHRESIETNEGRGNTNDGNVFKKIDETNVLDVIYDSTETLYHTVWTFSFQLIFFENV